MDQGNFITCVTSSYYYNIYISAFLSAQKDSSAYEVIKIDNLTLACCSRLEKDPTFGLCGKSGCVGHS
jgi:hypothetical protein